MLSSQGVESVHVFGTFNTQKDVWIVLYYLVLILSCLFGFLVTGIGHERTWLVVP